MQGSGQKKKKRSRAQCIGWIHRNSRKSDRKKNTLSSERNWYLTHWAQRGIGIWRSSISIICLHGIMGKRQPPNREVTGSKPLRCIVFFFFAALFAFYYDSFGHSSSFLTGEGVGWLNWNEDTVNNIQLNTLGRREPSCRHRFAIARFDAHSFFSPFSPLSISLSLYVSPSPEQLLIIGFIVSYMFSPLLVSYTDWRHKSLFSIVVLLSF